MQTAYRLAILGFSDIERSTLASCFGRPAHRPPQYQSAPSLDEADFVIADADHPPSRQLVQATECEAQTLFIGRQQVAGALAWLARPVNLLQVLRELDAMVLRRQGPAAPELVAAPTVSEPPARASFAALIVDPVEGTRQALQAELTTWGVAVGLARDSAQTFERLSTRGYDFVFVAMELDASSDLDGLGLCQHLKRHPSAGAGLGTQVYLLASRPSEIDRVRAALAGCDALLAAPPDEAELRNILLAYGVPAPAARP